MKTCGNCKHMKVLHFTPTGRPQKGKYCDCTAMLTLVKPMAYRVEIIKGAVWPDTDATACVTWEEK